MLTPIEIIAGFVALGVTLDALGKELARICKKGDGIDDSE